MSKLLQPKEEAKRMIELFRDLADAVVDQIVVALNIPKYSGDPENFPKGWEDGLYWHFVYII